LLLKSRATAAADTSVEGNSCPKPRQLNAPSIPPLFVVGPTAAEQVEAKTFNRTGYHYGVEFLAIDNSQRQSVDQLRMHLASFAIGD